MKSAKWYAAIRKANSRPRTEQEREFLASLRVGSHASVETRRKMSAAHSQRFSVLKDDCCGMCGSSKHTYDEHQQRLVEARRNSKQWHEAIARSNSDRKTGGKANRETRNKMSASQKIAQNKPERLAQLSEFSKRFWASLSKRQRREISTKISLAQEGRTPACFGFRCWYEGPKGRICMRSTWEEKFARKLDKWGIDWEYEGKSFELGRGRWKGRKYYPDFYIPEYDLHVEVKGYLRADNRRKLEAFKKKFPEVNWMLMDKNALEQLGVL